MMTQFEQPVQSVPQMPKNLTSDTGLRMTVDSDILYSHQAYLTQIANYRLDQALRIHVSVSDIVQDTFVSAYRQLRNSAPGGIRNFKYWLGGILKLKIREQRRKYGNSLYAAQSLDIKGSTDVEISEPGISCDPSRNVDSADTFAWAMAELPENQRLVVELRLLHCLSNQEVAEALGISEHCARKRYKRARKFLEDRIDPNEYL